MSSGVTYNWNELIARAKAGVGMASHNTSSENPGTASAFASWVFYLSHPERVGNTKLADATFKAARTREIEVSKLLSALDGIPLLGRNKFVGSGDWVIVYLDPLSQEGSPSLFEAPNLLIGSNPLRCKPDVVLFNRANDQLLIVERKISVTTETSIPQTCYPNVLAQLWCYSQIDFGAARWPNPKQLILAADIWSHRKSESEDDGRENYWVWLPSDPQFKNVEVLFSLYREQIAAQSGINAP